MSNLKCALLALAMTALPMLVQADEIEALLVEAQASQSSGVVVIRAGEVLLDWVAEPDGAPIETMSVTKSIVALGVARMLTTGELASLDMPLAEIFPEWRQGRKAEVTVRHLLNHTSGLQNHPNAGAEIYPSPDFVQLALAAELEHVPGSHYAYNNKATNLIAGLFPPLTGSDMAEYMGRELFAPMGIEHWDWYRDAAGNPAGMAGLQLHPRDLARFGQLVLDGGRIGELQLIDEDVLLAFMAPGSSHNDLVGLLWWREPAWQRRLIDEQSKATMLEAGVDPEFVARLNGATGSYDSLAELYQALERVLGEDWRDQFAEHVAPHGVSISRQEASEEIVAWYGDGYLGQFLVVVPETRTVGVRMIRYFEGVGRDHQFSEFRRRIVELD
jgi:CubicO group peptidase (beta-lactamase class C family)